jgi:hypothetical protein
LGLGGSVREQARNMLENCERLDQAKVWMAKWSSSATANHHIAVELI